MNEYRFEEIISQEEDRENCTKEEFSVTITSDMMQKFLDITGDVNPLHTDASFASDKGFKDRVVYGMLTSSFYSTLAGVYLPGKYCILQGVESSFNAPVFIGDTLTISGFVKTKFESTRTIEISVRVTNQDGRKVGKGKIKAGFLNEQ